MDRRGTSMKLNILFVDMVLWLFSIGRLQTEYAHCHHRFTIYTSFCEVCPSTVLLSLIISLAMLYAIHGVASIYGTLYILVDPVTRPMVKNPWARWTMSMGGGGKRGNHFWAHQSVCGADRYFRILGLGLADASCRIFEENWQWSATEC